MHIRIVTFRLAGPSDGTYRAEAVAIADSFNEWPGLLAKLWLADPERHRYGGVYLFASAADAEASRWTPQFLALAESPVFTDLRVEEHAVLDEPTAITAGPLLAALAAGENRAAA